MITIEKTYGVKGVANDATMLRLQELIFLADDSAVSVPSVAV